MIPRAFLVPQVLCLFVLLDLGFKIWGFERVRQSLIDRARRHHPRDPQPSRDSVILASTVSAVESATRYYYRSRRDCLPTAMSIYYMLRRHGIPAELCVGVRKYPFGAHAWVEYLGKPVGDLPTTIEEFTILSRH